ncbi:hypothetical protein [Paenibacillus dendrobii]|uniref:hypothetical protein n=1 Tax=Paenibacillus dendrobii TaxID=2691084 RepID=UPI0019210A1A|nr:hypothetical protein [Paenibacillus dendrobii]
MEVCKLCGEKATLEVSHIIPKFVFDYIKKTSATGRFRMPLDNPNIPKQDGDKMKLLCGKCEDLFSKNETHFATNIFHRFQKDNIQEFNYDAWLNYFITSVNWRNLQADIGSFSSNKSVSPDELECLISSEKIMKDFLLGNKEDLGYIDNHIFFFNRIKKTNNKEVVENGPHVFFRRSVFGYTLINHNPGGIYVYSNLAGILICTILKPSVNDNWEGTQVGLSQGSINMPQNIASPIINDLFDYMLECKQVSMSDQQRTKLIERVKKDQDKLIKSKFIEFWKYDRDLESNN